MYRTVTAIYRSRAIADLVRQDLDQIGIPWQQVTILPDTDVTGRSDRTSGNIEDAFDGLHDLHLPESDTRTYQQAIRNGDYVVSVSVGDDANIAHIEQIMRRPEDSYDLSGLDTGYADADYVPRRQPLGATYDNRMIGHRDEKQLSPHTRSYRRELPLTAAPLGSLGAR